jgi:type II secretory pathway pseudopilin PulG
MKTRGHRTAITLVEMLIVVAVVAILMAMVIRMAGRIDTQAGERLAHATFGLIDTALGQFAENRFRYDGAYRDFIFPPDCTGFDQAGFENTVAGALGAVTAAVSGGVYDPNYSSSAGAYLFLSMVPQCRAPLEQIDESLLTDKDAAGSSLKITVDDGRNARVYPLVRFIDPWGTSLRYSYCEDLLDPATRRTFPILVSAGPDRLFGTADDVTSE